eukprot:TRINITY_DN14016_c0_g1_i1.p1 TRINITY_DN14016_c0_g1~~TRINITY_DN14016_c0_g1_i1.p1  ORF type:complete len:500 (-),score=83.73 TRINITY_DN14016_c0_g1_i1:36-1487(-)
MPVALTCLEDGDFSGGERHRRKGMQSRGADGGAVESRNEVLQGVVGVLKQAQSALLRLGVGASPQGGSPRGNTDGAQAADSGLESLVASLQAVLVPAAKVAKHGSVGVGAIREAGLRGNTRTEADIKEFVTSNGLESWVAEILAMLSPSQRASLMNSQLNLETARNPNAVVVSRVKQITSVEQRMQMFIKVNDLAEGVIDRISTLTAEQCEGVIANGMKIQKANNPSGVAMKRISESIRANPSRSGRNTSLSLMGSHGGDVSRSDFDYRDPGGLFAIRDRSPSPTDHGYHQGNFDHASSLWPADVKAMVDDFNLENWCGEVLRRLSLFQRQSILRDQKEMRGVRNPSGVVMSRVKSVASNEELTTIFVDLNSLGKTVADKLWSLTPQQRADVIAPGIYVQNVRNPANVVRSRISRVEEGRTAVEGGARIVGGAGGRGRGRGSRGRFRMRGRDSSFDDASSDDEPSRSRSRSSRREHRGRRRFR